VNVVPDRAHGIAEGTPAGGHEVEATRVEAVPYRARRLATKPLELGNARRS